MTGRMNGRAYLACGVDALFIEALRNPADQQRAYAQFAARTRCGPTWWKAGRRRCRAWVSCRR
jgi:hypothetical protein